MMGSIEIIRLRGSEPDSEVISKELQKSFNEYCEGDAKCLLWVLKNSSIQSDLAVFISWIDEEITEQGTALGMQIAWFLRSFGLVRHEVWNEVFQAKMMKYEKLVNT